MKANYSELVSAVQDMVVNVPKDWEGPLFMTCDGGLSKYQCAVLSNLTGLKITSDDDSGISIWRNKREFDQFQHWLRTEGRHLSCNTFPNCDMLGCGPKEYTGHKD